MDNRIKDIGVLNGQVLVFGGVYGNLQALEALIKVAEEKNIPKSNIICTGDVVAYCAQPEECVQLMRSWEIHCIAGNVEIQLSTGQDDCACDFIEGGRCDTFSKNWYPFVRSQLSEASLKWMRQLPEFLRFKYSEKSVLVVHGSYHYTSEYIFKSTEWKTKQNNFDDSSADIILAGHCGLPFSQEESGKHWLNPGVIGMPANDGTSRVWFVMLDDHAQQFNYQHLPLLYDFKKANDLMLAKQLPEAYAKTLITGVWDNCEILPETETKNQGKALSF